MPNQFTLHLELSDGARDAMADALEKTFVRYGIHAGALDLRTFGVVILEAFCANASLTDWDRLQEHRDA